jgi:hypothetical protein
MKTGFITEKILLHDNYMEYGKENLAEKFKKLPELNDLQVESRLERLEQLVGESAYK